MSISPVAFPQDVPVSDNPSGMFSSFWFLLWNSFATTINALVAAANAQTQSGIVRTTQTKLGALGKTLSVDQLVEVTDYGHVLRWTGAAFTWGPGEQGSGMMVLFEVDPTGVGWHLYDGTANVPYLKSDGTTGTKTLPDLVSAGVDAVYLKAGSPNSGPNAAVAPTSPTVTNPANTGSGAANLGNNTAANNVQPYGSGVPAPVAKDPHSHVDSGHTHTIAAPTVGAVGSDGEPRNLVRRPWFRQ